MEKLVALIKKFIELPWYKQILTVVFIILLLLWIKFSKHQSNNIQQSISGSPGATNIAIENSKVDTAH